jgi:protein-tyrosine phosphatase
VILCSFDLPFVTNLVLASLWQLLKQSFQPGIDHIPGGVAPAGEPLQVYPFEMHCHVLPGVDDGLQQPEDSLTYLRQMAQWGIRHVVATPHISQDLFPNTTSDLRHRADALRQLIEAEQIPITFDVAAEYMTDELFADRLRANDLLSFGTQRFVLIETGWALLPRHLPQWLFQLQVQGYRPVLAHPERYRHFWPRPEALGQLREQGCLLQLNTMSLVGRYGGEARRVAQYLIRQGWVDFVSSDLHRLGDFVQLEAAIRSTDYQKLYKLDLMNID